MPHDGRGPTSRWKAGKKRHRSQVGPRVNTISHAAKTGERHLRLTPVLPILIS
jgi:hypothetical protein